MRRERYWLYSGTVLRGGRALAFGVVALASSPVAANPEGGQVSAGHASIQNRPGTLTVEQHTDRAVIDWTSFNIAPGEATRFRQPAVTSAILNRIHDQNPSQILGNLSANGQVALVNPNGMVFGKGSRVDVSGLVATSADIANQSFMSARPFAFGLPGLPDSAVINKGTMTVDDAGLAALVAPEVRNEGVITAKAGKVTLASGDTMTLDLYGDKLVSVAASDRLKRQSITQSGSIEAAGGEVVLTTAEAAQVIDRVINMDGWVDVGSLAEEGGSIVLHAAGGDAHVRGQLHADSVMDDGGRILITGDNIRVAVGAVLTASGYTGGGNIKIGGDYLGGGTTPHAKTAIVEKGVEIKANATGAGDGGRVIVWSDDRTDFAGLIQAKGGLLKGNGGFIETSSKEVLIAHGLADASAPKGIGGEWLLDPNSITINTTADANVAGAPDFVTTDDNAVVTVASILASLNAGTNVSVTTGTAGGNAQTGSITVASAIGKTAGGDATLLLKARNNITVNANISSTSSKLNVTLWSDSDNSGAGGITMTNAAITSNGGNVTLGGGGNPAANPAIGDALYGVELNNGDISTGAGSLSIRGQGEGAGTDNIGLYIHNGSVLQSTSGNISLTATGGNGTNANHGIYVLDGTTAITSADGDISLIGHASGNGTNNRGVYFESGSISSTGATKAAAGTITIDATSSGSTGDGFSFKNSTITSVAGDIDITGVSVATGSDWQGIYLGNSSITSTGTAANAADITLDGTGGNGTGLNHGVQLHSSGISTVDGDIDISGGAGSNGAGASNHGIFIETNANIQSTGTGAGAGNIVLSGTGGAGAGTDHGIFLQSAGTVTAAGPATITMTGQAGSGTGVDIKTITGANVIGGAAAGDVTLIGNTMDFANLTASSAEDIILKPRTAATTIGLNGAAGTLNLTSTELGFFTPAGVFIIGDSAAGSGAVNIDAWALAGKTYDVEVYGGSIDFGGAVTFNQANDLLFHARAGDVTADQAITKSGGGTSNLILKASNSIVQTATISSSSGALNVTEWADSDNSGAGGISLTNASITSNGGNVTLGGGTDPTTDDAVGAADNGVELDNSAISTGAGNISIRGQAEAEDKKGVYIQSGSLVQTTTGNITIDGVAVGATGTDYNNGVEIYDSAITTADGDIHITGTSTGTGDFNQGISLFGNSTISSTGTGAGAGNITLDGTGSDSGDETNYGVYLGWPGVGSGSVTTVDGDIDITGIAGDGTGSDNIGIFLEEGSTIISTGTGADAGNITLDGTGGDGTGFNFGLWITDAGTLVSAVDGDIEITGQGGMGSASNNYGMSIETDAQVISTGVGADAGNITLEGTGGGGVNLAIGIDITSSANAVTTVDGDISITGTGGGGTGNNAWGVDVYNGSGVRSTGAGAGAGNITITGTGGTAAGGLNYGVYLLNTGEVTAAGPGTITLTGQAGATSGDDIRTENGANVLGGAAAGDVTLTGNTMNFANLTVTSAADIYVRQRTAVTSIGLGGGAGTLNLTDAELALFDAGSELILGRADGTGAMIVDAYNAWNSPIQFLVDPTGSITVSGAQAATAASDAAFTFSGPVALNAGVSTSGATGGTGAILFGDDVTLGADVTVNGGAGGTITFSDIVNGSRDLTLSAGGAITLNGVVGGVTPLDDLTITTNANPAINANVSGGGILTLDTLSAGTTMGLGGAAGTVNYAAAELGRFASGWTLINIGNTAQTGATTVGALTWSDPVHFRANAAGSVVISGAQTAVAASDTTFTFTGPASLAANVDTTNATGGTQDITFNNAATLTANAQVLAGNGDITFSSTIDGAFDLTLNAAGAITLTGNVGGTTPLDDLTLTSDADPVIGGSVAGTGVLTLQQKSNATTMGVAGGAGTLNYSAAELAGLGAGWSTIRLGSTTATGALTVGANAWASPVQYRSAAAGSIVISGAQTAVGASDASFTFSGPTTLGANVSTTAAIGGTQDITFNDDVTLTGNSQVLAGNGDLSVAGTIDGAFDLTLSAAGTITLSDDIGAGAALDDLTIASDADPTIGGTVDGTGVLTLQQASNATTMGVAGGAGALNYSLADLAALGSNWTSMRFGSTTATGTLTVGANAWDIPVDYRAAVAGSIVISGAQTALAASDTIFTFSGPATINAPLDLSNATGGTQAITFNDTAAVNADITSGGGDIVFNDTLSLNADVATSGGDITLADDVTLTGISSIDTDTTDIGFDGTLDGIFDLTLSTTGDVDFSDDVGTGAALDDLAIAGAADVTFAGQLNAASFTLTGGTGAVLVTDAANVTNDLGITTTGTVTFGDTLVYGGDAAVDAGASAIVLTGAIDGPGDFELTTTNDITFGDNVGAVTRLGDVMLDPQHVAAAGVFNVGSFTLVNGTGNVSFLGLDATGDISIDTDGNITGTYAGADGMLDAGTGSITATVSFTTLDIAGATATLSDGYIGAPGVADQAMANLISIGVVAYPVLVPDPAYTFAAFIIGASPPTPPGGGGGGGGAGGSHTPPVLPPDSGTGPGPVTPPVAEPGGRPVTSAPETSFDPLLLDIARLQCSAAMMAQSAKLPAGAACGAASASASWDAVLPPR